jgi:tetratricopeptide (TPR) repeat protein
LKPIGTITKYYPLLAKETVETIEPLVEEAENYRNFILKLIDAISSYPMSSELAQFAVIQASTIGFGYDDEVWDKIRPRCQEDIVVKPWSFASNPSNWTQDDEGGFERAIEQAIATKPAEWMLFHLYALGAYFPRVVASTHADFNQYLEEARSLVKKNPLLRGLSPRLDHIESEFAGSEERGIEFCEEAVRISREYDDVYAHAEATRRMAGWLENEPQKALDLLENAHRLFESINDRASVGLCADMMGDIYYLLGEFDYAIKFFCWDVDRAGSTLRSTSPRGSYISTQLARIFCDLDLPDQAVEWLSWHTDGRDLHDLGRYVHLQSAIVHFKLNHLEKGAKHLGRAYEIMLKMGRDQDIARYNFAQGISELANGQPDAALHLIEQALAEFTRLDYRNSINQCLLELTRIEISIARSSGVYSDTGTSGQWMDRLESIAKSRNYQGILIYQAILKAQYQELVGKHKDSLTTLENTLKMAESPGVKTLRERIINQIRNLQESYI